MTHILNALAEKLEKKRLSAEPSQSEARVIRFIQEAIRETLKETASALPEEPAVSKPCEDCGGCGYVTFGDSEHSGHLPCPSCSPEAVKAIIDGLKAELERTETARKNWQKVANEAEQALATAKLECAAMRADFRNLWDAQPESYDVNSELGSVLETMCCIALPYVNSQDAVGKDFVPRSSLDALRVLADGTVQKLDMILNELAVACGDDPDFGTSLALGRKLIAAYEAGKEKV